MLWHLGDKLLKLILEEFALQKKLPENARKGRENPTVPTGKSAPCKTIVGEFTAKSPTFLKKRWTFSKKRGRFSEKRRSFFQKRGRFFFALALHLVERRRNDEERLDFQYQFSKAQWLTSHL